MRTVLVRIVALLLAFVLAACSSSGGRGTGTPSDLNDNTGAGTYAGLEVESPLPRPTFTLADTAGRRFSFSSTAGRPTFLFFGYTNCPDVCPASMIDIHDAIKKQPVALQKKTVVVFVTTDVKHDTGPVIARWLRNFTTGIKATVIGLRGTQTEIDAAQAAAHIQIAEDDGQTHSALVLLYGADDYAHVQYPQSSNESSLMAHDLPLVAK